MRYLITAAALAAFFVPAAGQGQSFCAGRHALRDNLAPHHEEAPAARGLAASGQVLELLVSPTGSWSIIISHPTGRSCLMGAGQAWQTLPRPTKPKGEPS